MKSGLDFAPLFFFNHPFGWVSVFGRVRETEGEREKHGEGSIPHHRRRVVKTVYVMATSTCRMSGSFARPTSRLSNGGRSRIGRKASFLSVPRAASLSSRCVLRGGSVERFVRISEGGASFSRRKKEKTSTSAGWMRNKIQG